MDRKWVYLFTELEAAEAAAGDWEAVRGLLGGKGANLAEMLRIQVPVPPGFTVTTEACSAYLREPGEFPEDVWDQQIEALKRIEDDTGKEFGNPKKPLLVSCRSGGKVLHARYDGHDSESGAERPGGRRDGGSHG